MASYQAMSSPVAVVGGGASLGVPVLPNLTWSKSFLLGHVYPLSESSWHLGVYPWSRYYVRQQWDRFSTQVHAIGCAWVPVAPSRRARCLRLPLPEAPGLAMLIHCRKPSGAFDWRPRPCPGSRREAGQADMW
jgi:hypothetical protein